MKAFVLLLLLIITGCGSSNQETGYNFAGLHLQPSANWKIAEAAQPVMATMEFNQGKKCKLLECPRLDLYTSDFSGWKSWFDGTVYVGSRSCDNPASAYGLPLRLPSGDIDVGGVKAEYFESASCISGMSAQRTWLLQRPDDPDLIILGTAAMKDDDPAVHGYFPDEEFKRMLTAATWE